MNAIFLKKKQDFDARDRMPKNSDNYSRYRFNKSVFDSLSHRVDDIPNFLNSLING